MHLSPSCRVLIGLATLLLGCQPKVPKLDSVVIPGALANLSASATSTPSPGPTVSPVIRHPWVPDSIIIPEVLANATYLASPTPAPSPPWLRSGRPGTVDPAAPSPEAIKRFVQYYLEYRGLTSRTVGDWMVIGPAKMPSDGNLYSINLNWLDVAAKTSGKIAGTYDVRNRTLLITLNDETPRHEGPGFYAY